MKNKTITYSELARLQFCNSKDMPQVINHNGRSKRWVGIGWVDEGSAGNYETVVIDD